MPQKNYYAVVNKKTNRLECVRRYPLIYTYKNRIPDFFKRNFDILPVPVADLEALILKQRNKKAK